MTNSRTPDSKELIEELLSDKEKFNAYVYTPLDAALAELITRDANKNIHSFLSEMPAPNILKPSEDKFMALARSVATPNYEMHRFNMCADVLKLNPKVIVYSDDTFKHINELKYMLGKLHFHKGYDRETQPIFQKKSVIDMNRVNGNLMKNIDTLWEQNFIEFHHDFFKYRFPHLENSILDISEWLHTFGPCAKDYYQGFMSLFLRDGILFETYLFDEKEIDFHKNILLPTIIEIEKKTGAKPLIVALEPTRNEGGKFWNSYPPSTLDYIKKKLDK